MSLKTTKASSLGGLTVGLVAVSFAGVLIRLCAMNPFAISAMRTLAGGLILLPFALKHLRGDLAKLTKQERWLLVIAGLIMAAHFAAWVTSVFHTKVGSAMMTFGAQPIFAGIVAHFFLGERFRRSGIIALAITFAGIGIIAANDYSANPGSLLGSTLALVGAITMASILCIARVLRRKMHIMSYASSVYLIAGLALAPSLFFTAGEFGDYDGSQWLFLALIIVVPQLTGHTMLNWAMKHFTAFTVNLSSLVEPILTAIMAYFILSETQNYFFVAGGTLILGGIGYHLISGQKARYAISL